MTRLLKIIFEPFHVKTVSLPSYNRQLYHAQKEASTNGREACAHDRAGCKL